MQCKNITMAKFAARIWPWKTEGEPLFAGISTACLYPMETEKALQALIAQGVRKLEVFINAACELESGFVARLLQTMVDGGAEIIAIHPHTSGDEGFWFFGEYQRRFDDGLEAYKRLFEVSSRLGSRIVIFHGAGRNYTLPIESYAERYSILLQAAKQQGVQLCHENVERSRSRSPEFFYQLRRLLPEAGFVLDVKQAIRAACAPEEMLEAMGHAVRHVHISDSTPEHDCLPVGKGSFAFDGLLYRLRSLGYTGALMQEVYRPSFAALPELVQSYDFLQKML